MGRSQGWVFANHLGPKLNANLSEIEQNRINKITKPIRRYFEGPESLKNTVSWLKSREKSSEMSFHLDRDELNNLA